MQIGVKLKDKGYRCGRTMGQSGVWSDRPDPHYAVWWHDIARLGRHARPGADMNAPGSPAGKDRILLNPRLGRWGDTVI
jgi:hypothetical protein